MPTFKLKVKIEDVEVLKATDKALLCRIDGKDVWIPQSQVDDDSEVFDDNNNSSGTLVISEWLATEKGLI